MTTTFAHFTETPHIDRGNEQLVLTTPSLYAIIFNILKPQLSSIGNWNNLHLFFTLRCMYYSIRLE